jgi:hypothetical protein
MDNEYTADAALNYGIVTVTDSQGRIVADIGPKCGMVYTPKSLEDRGELSTVLGESFSDWRYRVYDALHFRVPSNLRPKWDIERGSIRVWRNPEPPPIRFNMHPLRSQKLVRSQGRKRAVDR